jgi:hypothetical protein
MIYLSEINEDFFTVGEIIFNEEMESSFSDQEIKWSDLKSVKFSKSKEDVVVTLKDENNFIIPSDTSGLIAFFKYLPAAYNDEEQTKYLNQIYSEMTSCKVCGNIAVWNNQCNVCHCDQDDVTSSDADEELNNVIVEQLQLFATYEEGEPIDWDFPNDTKFERNPNWKLLVTEKEILDFSRENSWE